MSFTIIRLAQSGNWPELFQTLGIGRLARFPDRIATRARRDGFPREFRVSLLILLASAAALPSLLWAKSGFPPLAGALVSPDF